MKFAHVQRLLAPFFLASLAGCQIALQPLPGPVEYERTPKPEGVTLGTSADSPRRPQRTTVQELPSAPTKVETVARMPPAPLSAADAEEVSIAIEQTPLPTFIQILYGSVLKLPYTMDPAVSTRTDPVTFKTTRPLSRAVMRQLAVNLLRSYGLAVQDFDGLVRIAPEGAPNSSSLPVLRRGTSTDSGSEALRPVFQYVELDVVRTSDMTQWLRQMLGTRVNLQEDAARNAFLLSGNQADVKAALELIQSLDQPRMRGRVARRITPAYANANDLASRLVEVLTAQGYAVAIGASTTSAASLVIPVPSIGSLVVFASSTQTMDHISRWAQELDRPAVGATGSNSLFTYPVRFADAQELARTLSELLGGSPAPQPAAGSGPTGTATAAPRSFSGGRVVVNNATNTLIFRGSSPDEQQQIRQLLRELDRPTKSAMIEVVVAELAVGALQRLGVQWTLSNQGNIGNAQSSTFGGSGFNLSYASSARQVLSMIDALANDSQARVLSNPKVLARNGETATIQVGSEVPIVTSQQSTTSAPGPFPGAQTGILQQIQYRSTGVILKVRPVINSGNRLDLEVSQEVSSASSTETGVTSTPTISTRKIDTKLSLRDGSTVLLGGLISRDVSTSKSGVPFLKDIPGVGALFRNQSDTTAQKELLVMITPYVLNDDFEAEEITEAIQKSFGPWAQDIKTSRIVRRPEVAASEASTGNELESDRLGPVMAPPTVEPLLPAVTPPPLPGSAPVAAPAPTGSDTNGIVMSAPTRPAMASPAVLPANAEPLVSSPAAPAAAASAAAAPAAPRGTTAIPPGGKPVTDRKLLEEFRQQLRNQGR